MIRPVQLSVSSLFAIGILVSSCFGAPDPKKEFKSFALTVAHKEANAYEHKDSGFFERLYTPDFKTKDDHGINGKKVAIFLLRYHFNSLQKVTYSTKILSVDMSGKVGTVKMMSVLNGVTQSRGGSKGTVIKVTRLEKQVFVKLGDQWLMNYDEDLKKPSVVMVGAQPFAPMRMTPAIRH